MARSMKNECVKNGWKFCCEKHKVLQNNLLLNESRAALQNINITDCLKKFVTAFIDSL
jgi:hypothetical protein